MLVFDRMRTRQPPLHIVVNALRPQVVKSHLEAVGVPWWLVGGAMTGKMRTGVAHSELSH